MGRFAMLWCPRIVSMIVRTRLCETSSIISYVGMTLCRSNLTRAVRTQRWLVIGLSNRFMWATRPYPCVRQLLS